MLPVGLLTFQEQLIGICQECPERREMVLSNMLLQWALQNCLKPWLKKQKNKQPNLLGYCVLYLMYVFPFWIRCNSWNWHKCNKEKLTSQLWQPLDQGRRDRWIHQMLDLGQRYWDGLQWRAWWCCIFMLNYFHSSFLQGKKNLFLQNDWLPTVRKPVHRLDACKGYSGKFNWDVCVFYEELWRMLCVDWIKWWLREASGG